MTESQFVLKCPYCSCTFVPEPPENKRWHSEFSLEKPLMSSDYGDFIEQKIVCKIQNAKNHLQSIGMPQWNTLTECDYLHHAHK